MTVIRDHSSARVRGFMIAVLATACMLPGATMAQNIGKSGLPQVAGFPNMIGIGVGSTPDYVGADSRSVKAAPVLRYQLPDSHRYVSVLGPLISVNLVNDRALHAGALLRYRFGRKDADDPVVRKLHEINDAVEVGAFVSYGWSGKGAVPWKLRASTSVSSGFGNRDGMRASIGGHFLTPVSRRALVGVGGSVNFIDGRTMRSFYGITPADSLASGLTAYQPGGGRSSQDFWIGAGVLVHAKWLVGGGAYWQHLRGNAADSPWVRQHGCATQVTWGIGVARLWK